MAINKLDKVGWSEERYNHIKEYVQPFLKQIGFQAEKIHFVPISGLIGTNLIDAPKEKALTSWYHGNTLF